MSGGEVLCASLRALRADDIQSFVHGLQPVSETAVHSARVLFRGGNLCKQHRPLDISREENAVVLSGGAARAPLIARDSLLKKRQLARIFWTALIVELI